MFAQETSALSQAKTHFLNVKVLPLAENALLNHSTSFWETCARNVFWACCIQFQEYCQASIRAALNRCVKTSEVQDADQGEDEVPETSLTIALGAPRCRTWVLSESKSFWQASACHFDGIVSAKPGMFYNLCCTMLTLTPGRRAATQDFQSNIFR